MKPPRLVTATLKFFYDFFCLLAVVRYWAPISASLYFLVKALWQYSGSSVWDYIWSLSFLLIFALQYFADIIRERWEANKKDYRAHVQRHRIYAFSLFILWCYCFLKVGMVFFPSWLVFGFLVFEYILVIRHQLWPGKVAPSRPLPDLFFVRKNTNQFAGRMNGDHKK